MAAVIFLGIASKIGSQLGPLASKEILLAWDVEKQLEELKDTVSIIAAELQQAEEIHITGMGAWLLRIKDAAYEADDIIDDFAREALQHKGVSTMVRNFISSSNPIFCHLKLASRIREVREKLNTIASDKSFHLETKVEDRSACYKEREHTHSHVDESKVTGREGDKEKIIQLLLDTDEQENLSIIPIQGMGGLGKTTLAQFVYNDERLDVFKPKLWVCVSEEFDVKKVIEKIIKSATNNECPNLEMDQLQSRLREQLGDKRFLLVLDDVWNENVDKWCELKEFFIRGANGSKIIVTTRSEKVASITGTVLTHQLSSLTIDDCWNVFRKMAFVEGQEELHPHLVDAGKEIVRKCGGVPLAAKTLGSLLCYKTEEHDWKHVRDTDICRLPQEERGILPTLRLSYNHLPSSFLKQCFAFCSIFPKNHAIEKDMLIQVWIAEGFIHSSEENQCLEDIGNEYVKVLLWRSLFQDPELDHCKNLVRFQMHELVHNLAQSVADVECFTLENDPEEHIPVGVRHLCVNLEFVSSESLGYLSTTLRTLFILAHFTCSNDNFFSSFSSLRVLIFKHFDNVNFPSSIGKLKHLRYLELCSSHIRTLPKSFTQLQFLRTLKLWCERLEELPRDIGEMISLRYICVKRCLSLSYMPVGLEQLTSLQTLSMFIVSKQGVGCELSVLHRLNHLGGMLIIKNLENVSRSSSAEGVLKGKQNLRVLKALWNEVDDGDTKDVEASFEVLENLEPHRNLMNLKLIGYGGASFPRWMMKPLLPVLTSLTFSKCRRCQRLPPFSQLPSLKFLKLEKMDSLQFIEGLQGMTSLESLKILDCESLISLLTHLPSLKTLHVIRCKKMFLWKDMDGLPSLQTLEIDGNPDLEVLPEALQKSTKLQIFKIRNCERLIALPKYLGYFSLLQHLTVYRCDNLMTWPNGLAKLSLDFLHISSSVNLPSLPQELQHLTSLRYLGIADFTSLTTLPEWLGNLTSLRLLQIYGCTYLESLPVWMQRLTALKELHIDLCDQLTFRCQKDIGMDWDNIAHVPKIMLNRTRIQ
ncbi:hypothetical protein ACHQM5_003106 [Ranunculus cassubicifolius]